MSVDYTIPPWEPDLLGNPPDDQPKPTRRQAEMRFAALADAAGLLIASLRPHGTCMLCKAAPGVAHATHCPTWPLIRARAETVHGQTAS